MLQNILIPKSKQQNCKHEEGLYKNDVHQKHHFQINDVVNGCPILKSRTYTYNEGWIWVL